MSDQIHYHFYQTLAESSIDYEEAKRWVDSGKIQLFLLSESRPFIGMTVGPRRNLAFGHCRFNGLIHLNGKALRDIQSEGYTIIDYPVMPSKYGQITKWRSWSRPLSSDIDLMRGALPFNGLRYGGLDEVDMDRFHLLPMPTRVKTARKRLRDVIVSRIGKGRTDKELTSAINALFDERQQTTDFIYDYSRHGDFSLVDVRILKQARDLLLDPTNEAALQADEYPWSGSRKRATEIHFLIERVYRANREKSQARRLWKLLSLEQNPYDHHRIIEQIDDDSIDWRDHRDAIHSLGFHSFESLLSDLKKFYSR